MFGLGPAYTFLLENRLPFGFMRKGAMPWLSTMSTNAGLALAAGLLIWARGTIAGPRRPSADHLIGATAGVWLFYVQHQFEGDGLGADGGLAPARGGAARQLASTTCRRRSTGSAPTSACITCITCRAAFPSTGCARSCATIPSSAGSAG